MTAFDRLHTGTFVAVTDRQTDRLDHIYYRAQQSWRTVITLMIKKKLHISSKYKICNSVKINNYSEKAYRNILVHDTENILHQMSIRYNMITKNAF